jgi:threonine/homoserine/homoserine lactone efflux protein
MTLAAFLAAVGIHFLAAAAPGPAILMAARTGIVHGFHTGVFLAVGIGLGAMVWALAALFGLAVLFQIAPALFWVFKIIGAVLLIWMAWKIWRHAPDPVVMEGQAATVRSPRGALWLGLLTQLTNPKPAIFFGAVFVGTVPPGTPAGWLAALLIAVFLNELFCASVVARLFSFDRVRQTYSRLKTRIDRAFGGILALLGVKIALT